MTLAILAFDSNEAKFASFGIKRHQTKFQRNERRFVHPLRLKGLKSIKKTEEEKELDKISQPQIILLISPEEAKKMHEYMTLRKI